MPELLAPSGKHISSHEEDKVHTKDKELLSRERGYCCRMSTLTASINSVGQHRCSLHGNGKAVGVAKEMGSRPQLKNVTTGGQAANCFVDRNAGSESEKLGKAMPSPDR